MGPGNRQIQVHGHRGCRGLLPENTIPAFLKAAKLGVDALELDVVITGDSQVLVSHEPWFAAEYCLKPNSETIPPEEERQLNIYNLPYSTIKQYDCGTRQHPRFPDQQNLPAHKPLLSEVIEAVSELCRQRESKPPYFNIEIKSSAEGDNLFHPEPEVFVKLLLEVLATYNLQEEVMVQSFDVRTLQVLHRLAPTIKLGLLTEDLTQPEERLEMLGFIPYAYNPHYSLVNPELMELLNLQRIKCFVWTVNDEGTAQQMLHYGVSGIITDYPTLILDLIKSEHQSTKT